jgi:predicted metal-binding membrane protein
VLHRGIETALRRDRRVVAVSLAVVVGLAWFYLWREAASMNHTGGMRMAVMPTMDAGTLAVVFVMWVVMMVGMMLPSAAPTVLLYGAMARKNSERGAALPAVCVFASGYLLVWVGFSIAATLLQTYLEHAALLTPMMASASKRLSGLLLVAAGIYQLTPLKEICLNTCRNPVQFFVTHWRPGTGGALRMGMGHGAYCVGCCWMLMLLLFAAGVMNLAWVALIAAFVFVEKLLPAARLTSRFAGTALILTGFLVLTGAG